MKPILLFQRGFRQQHVSGRSLWVMAFLLYAHQHGVVPSCNALKFPAAQAATNHVACHHRGVDAEVAASLRKRNNLAGMPPAVHLTEQYCQQNACDHGAEAAGRRQIGLSHPRTLREDAGASHCKFFPDKNGNRGAAHDTAHVCTCSNSSLGASVEYTTSCSANGEHCLLRTLLAAAVDDQMLQQRLKIAARVYANPALSEALRLHNRQQVLLLSAKQQRWQQEHARHLRPTHRRQLQEGPRQQQPQQSRQWPGQQTEEQVGRQRQLVQNYEQSTPCELAAQQTRLLKKIPQQHMNGRPHLRQPRPGCTVVAVDNQKQQQKGDSQHTGFPVQADSSQIAAARAQATSGSNLGLRAENPQQREAAATITDSTESGSRSSGYVRNGKGKSSGSPPREKGGASNLKDSRSCATAQTHSSTDAGGFKKEVEGGRRLLPLARPVGWLLRQLQQHSCDRYSALMQLKEFLYGSGSSDIEWGTYDTSSTTSSISTTNGGSVGSLCAGSGHRSETAEGPLQSATERAAADIARLLDASLIVARVVRCAKCSAVFPSRSGLDSADTQRGPQSNHTDRTADVWHVLPASGFFVHSSGVLVTSFHVIIPSAYQDQQLHRQPGVVQQRKRQNQMQLQPALRQLHQQQRNQSPSEQQQQVHWKHCHHQPVHVPAKRKEIEEGNALTFFSSTPPIATSARHEGDDQREETQQEVLVVMDRTSRCWPVKTVLAASPHHDLAVLQIDWQGVIHPDTPYGVAPSTGAAAASTPAMQAAPLTRVPLEAVREERGSKNRFQCRQTTSVRQQPQEKEEKQEEQGKHQQQQEKHQHPGQQQNSGHTQKEQQERDIQPNVVADPKDRQREDSYAVGETADTSKDNCQQGEAGDRKVPWLPIENRGVPPYVGKHILVCSNPSGLAVTADFAQGSSGGAAVDAVTGRVIAVAQSTSSLYGSSTSGLEATAPPVQPYPFHPPLQMVIKTCIPIASLGLVIDKALAQQQALFPLCGSATCRGSEPAAAAAAAA